MLDNVRKDVADFAVNARDKVIDEPVIIFHIIFNYFNLISKSVEVYDYVKKDIDEFTQTVQEEVSSTATALKEKLKVLQKI